MKIVPMGSVAVARLRYYFEFLGHVILIAPQLFYRGLPNEKKGPLLERCYMVLSIVLLSADKRTLVKSSLGMLSRLANETRPEFAPVVNAMFQDKLIHLLPPMFFIVFKVVTGEIDDDSETKSILMQTATVMLDLSKNFHQLFLGVLRQVVMQMLSGPTSTPEICQQWTQRFAQCKDTFGFKTAITDFIQSVLR